MNILFDTLVYSLQSTGGISRMFNELIPRLIILNPFVNIQFYKTGLLKQPLPLIENLKIYNAEYIDLLLRPKRIWQNSYQDVFSFVGNKIIKSQKSTIWHSTYYNDFLGWQGKKIVTVHDMIYELFPGLYNSRYDENLRKIKKNTIHNADLIICVSNTTKHDLINLYSIKEEKIKVLYHGVSPSYKYLNKGEISNNHLIGFPFILYIGRRKCNKNFNELLRAYSAWEKNNEIFLLVVGSKWESDEYRTLKELKIEKKVVLMSNVSDNFLSALYNQARSFVYPSLYEGFGIPLLESMACGCPIVASSIPSTLEIAQDLPVYYKLGNIDSLLTALDKGNEAKEDRDRIEKGFIRRKDFSWEKSAKELLNIYRELI